MHPLPKEHYINNKFDFFLYEINMLYLQLKFKVNFRHQALTLTNSLPRRKEKLLHAESASYQ